MSEKASNPYSDLPPQAFWRSAVADKNAFEMSGLWDPKFQIRPKHKVATFGSCFAQHIGRALRSRGFQWFITEPGPPGLSEANMNAYNYDLFTCRTGNIYTASLLNQWAGWALSEAAVPSEYWMSKGRYIDPFRPRVEPDGFESLEEMIASRDHTLKAFRRAMSESSVFVFTLGLTESWFNKAEGYEYPMCPGTAGGTFDPAEHVFKNQQFEFIRSNLLQAVNKIRSVNPNVRFLFTVSPVPLTATNSGRHVLVATMESKSILRAVAAQMTAGRAALDYFPSYEIISSPGMGGRFFEPNQRNVSQFRREPRHEQLLRRPGSEVRPRGAGVASGAAERARTPETAGVGRQSSCSNTCAGDGRRRRLRGGLARGVRAALMMRGSASSATAMRPASSLPGTRRAIPIGKRRSRSSRTGPGG